MEHPPVSKSAKRRGGCEIEARGISYQICTTKGSNNWFNIWSRGVDGDGERVELQERHQQQQHKPTPTEVEDVEKKKRKMTQVRHVLRDVSCTARPWEVMAVVGPSGAGKSTLLEILAGRVPLPQSPPAVFVNGRPMERGPFRKISGYVAQKDVLFPLLTVRETLLFSASLRLGLPRAELASKVDALLDELRLDHVASARVGCEGSSSSARGISGGERRRVSIGVEVIHEPSVLILDEPTSGLDSASALQIVDMLKAMAEARGRTIVLSIHQPGFRILKLLNSILLLSGGSAVYHGTVDQLQAHLRAAGLEAPPHVNVLEFAIDAIDGPRRCQALESRRATGKPTDEDRRGRCTLQQLFQLHKPLPAEDTSSAVDVDCGDYANSWIVETTILTHRYLKNVFRTKELFACRTVQMLASGMVVGSVFYHLKGGVGGARERVGLFAFILTFLLSCTTEALPIFLQERGIVMKEASCGSYRLSSYVVANALAFLPFLLILALLFSVPLYCLVHLNPAASSACYFVLLIWLVLYTANSVVVCFSAISPNFIVGNSLVNGVLGAFFLFSGYFIRKEAMPSYWVFMHYISLFKYPFEGFLVNEFSDKCLEYEGGVCLLDGADVLGEVGLGEESRWRNVAIMVGLISLYRFLSYAFLSCRCRFARRGRLQRALGCSLPRQPTNHSLPPYLFHSS